MAKNNKSAGCKGCTCDKCGLEGHSIPGTTHRRCVGHAEATKPLPRGEHIPKANRGTWR